MLGRLSRLELGLDKIWTLTRIDLMEPGDVERYHRAGFGIGLGLESGDPRMLTLMGKTRGPGGFYERFRNLAREASRVGLPWGTNIIVGHPGETEESLERSARFVSSLFLDTENLTGFLSIDPFRFYHGSLVDRRLEHFEKTFGTHVYRRRWWNYSEQAFTCEWIDPSTELDYRQRECSTDLLPKT